MEKPTEPGEFEFKGSILSGGEFLPNIYINEWTKVNVSVDPHTDRLIGRTAGREQGDVQSPIDAFAGDWRPWVEGFRWVEKAIVLTHGAPPACATQDYEFVLALGGYTIRTVMTPEEHEVVSRVIERAMRESPSVDEQMEKAKPRQQKYEGEFGDASTPGSEEPGEEGT